MKSFKDRYCGTCKHFTGVQNDTCSAGVAYDSVRRPAPGRLGLPCFRDEAGGAAPCDRRAFPTPEEAEAAEQESERAIRRMAVARAAIVKETKGRRGVSGAIACPCCEGGTLSYSVASINGHIWAVCTTNGCASWME